MFKVKKIEEKLDLKDLKVNDNNGCKDEWKASRFDPNPFGDTCLTDCCKDCSSKNNNAYKSNHY